MRVGFLEVLTFLFFFGFSIYSSDKHKLPCGMDAWLSMIMRPSHNACFSRLIKEPGDKHMGVPSWLRWTCPRLATIYFIM
jgi:hypothetical protein